jgi:ABC-2 type transport system permease protein
MMSGPILIRAIAAQTAMELRLTLRRGESLLVTIVIPVVLLLFFASSRIIPGRGAHIAFLLPGTIALAVISTGLVSLGIATAYERYYRVLKRLGSTPFPRAGLVASKLLAVLAFEIAQIVLLVLVAVVVYGWRPHGSPLLAVLAVLLGSVAFAGLGLAMAGALRAEATLAGANGLFLFFLLLGDLYVPLSHLPGWVAAVAKLLPAAALAETLRGTLTTGASVPTEAAVVLVVWAGAAPLLAAFTFRWE